MVRKSDERRIGHNHQVGSLSYRRVGCSPHSSDARMRHAPDARLSPFGEDACVPDRTDVANLIRLGRDREAAELGASTIQGDNMDALAQLDQLGPVLSEVMGALTPADASP